MRAKRNRPTHAQHDACPSQYPRAEFLQPQRFWVSDIRSEICFVTHGLLRSAETLKIM